MTPAGRTALFALLVASLIGCAPPRQDGGLDAEAPLPQQLSQLGVLDRTARELRVRGGLAYTLHEPLFSDYAQKYRSVHLPADPALTMRAADRKGGVLEFPVGTLLTKTFYYPVEPDGRVQLLGPAELADPRQGLALEGVRLLETRVLLHRRGGWEAVSYLWDESGLDARRAPAGALISLQSPRGEVYYEVPDRNQCAGCHATDHGARRITPIGPRPGNLAPVQFGGNGQLEHWHQAGLLDASALASSANVARFDRMDPARTYLDVNCAHCHSGTGAADTSGLDLSVDAPGTPGLCKPPVAAGRGAGGLDYDVWPGRPEASILLLRMQSRDPGIMMPEVGRTLVHEEGVARVGAWISAMPGDCDAAG